MMNQPQAHIHVPSLLNPTPALAVYRWNPCVTQQIPLSVLHMVIHMFPGCAPNLSHPLLPALCPHVCYLCLFCVRMLFFKFYSYNFNSCEVYFLAQKRFQLDFTVCLVSFTKNLLNNPSFSCFCKQIKEI